MYKSVHICPIVRTCLAITRAINTMVLLMLVLAVFQKRPDHSNACDGRVPCSGRAFKTVERITATKEGPGLADDDLTELIIQIDMKVLHTCPPLFH